MHSVAPCRRLTVDEVLLFRRVDADQVAAVFPAVLLGILPGVPAAEGAVTVAVELPPVVLAALCVCEGREGLWVRNR